MALISLNPSPIIEQMRAWFFAKDRSIILADDTFIEGEDIPTPPTPIINRGRLYWKNKCWRQVDEDGNESSLCNGTIQDWTPTIDQGGNVAITVNYARYKVDGEGIVTISMFVTVTGAGAAPNDIEIQSFPHAGAFTDNDFAIGEFSINDGNAIRYTGALIGRNSTSWACRTSGVNAFVGTIPNFALAAGDEISFTAVYEKA